ncbi:hypothetical protein BDZ91DRAFT_410703 [Kalaharituber pfeilii]|nr:hypothetical protein BDZ91DRAFT_410703 [Kalaharituber pfeilii]
MSFLLPHYYRRRFNPEINYEDITTAKQNIEPTLTRLRELDNALRAIITRVSRNYNIPIPGAGMGLSTITSPTSPTGDMTRDSARLLLLYLRAVLSKGYFREVDRTWNKVEKFERSYWDEDEGEQTNTGFWKRLELGDEVLEEGIGYVKKWKDTKAREREWWPKIKELEDAIKEGNRWEQDVGLRRSSVGSNPSVSGNDPPLRGFRMSLIGAKPAARGSVVGSVSGSSSAGSMVDSVIEESDDELTRRREKWRRNMELRRNGEKELHAR